MDLSHPEYAVLGENRSRVLHRLSVLAEPASGRRIHELSGVRTLRTTQQILNDLVDVGLVTVRPVGAANAYSLNRSHVLWTPIEDLLSSAARAESAIAEIIEESIDGAAGAALFGSFARREAGSDSDIDILIVWKQQLDEDRAARILDHAATRIRTLTGNRAQMLALTAGELERLVELDDPIVESLRADARSISEGFDVKTAFGGRR